MQVAAKVTEAAVDAARVAYAPAGDFAALLFFCISDLVAIDPMYQYSLPWCVAVSLIGWHGSHDLNPHYHIQYRLYIVTCSVLPARMSGVLEFQAHQSVAQTG